MPRYRRGTERPKKKKKQVSHRYDDSDHPNLQWRRRCWYAVMAVPRDVQHRIGNDGKRKVRFVAPLNTDSLIEAADRLPAFVSRWRCEIAIARRSCRHEPAGNGRAFACRDAAVEFGHPG